MNNKKIYILIILIICGGIYSIYDLKSEKKELIGMNKEQINEINLLRRNQRIVLKKSDGLWRLAEPLNDLADNGAVEELLQGAQDDQYFDVAKDGESIDMHVYGLDNPFGSVVVRNNLNREVSLTISEVTNFEDHVYATKNNEKKVYTVHKNWLEKLKQSPFFYREKKFFRKNVGSVDEIHIKNSKGKVDLKRVNGRWEAQSPIAVDQDAVLQFLNKLAEAKAYEFLDQASARSISFKKAEVQVKLIFDSKSWELSLARLGQSLYAQTSDPYLVVKVDELFLNSIQKYEAKSFVKEASSKDSHGKN